MIERNSLPGGRIAAVLVALSAMGCGDRGPSWTGDGTARDTAPADTEDPGPVDVPGSEDGADLRFLQWRPYTPTITEKMRALAADPTGAGRYAIVADGGLVLRFSEGELHDDSPDNISAADLRGVYVDASGATVIAGNKSALAIQKKPGDAWQVAGEIPPSPAVEFLDVDGHDGTYWAVGMAGAAWRYSEGAWTPEAVTVTGGGEPIGKDPQFTAVAVTANEVWITCVPGAKSPGLALRRTDGGWRSYPLERAPRDIWVDADGVGGGVLVAGGAASEYVARLKTDAFVAESGLKWSQGFNAVDGLSLTAVWAAAFKGQLRRRDKAGWQVVTIQAPPGTPDSFPTPTADLVGLAVQAEDDFAVITAYKLYRYAEQ